MSIVPLSLQKTGLLSIHISFWNTVLTQEPLNQFAQNFTLNILTNKIQPESVINLVLSNRAFGNLIKISQSLQRHRYYLKSAPGYAVFLVRKGYRESAKFALLLTSSSELLGSRQKLLQSHVEPCCKRPAGFTDTSEISGLSLRFVFKFSTLIFSSCPVLVISGRTNLRELLLRTRCSCTRNTRDKNTWTANKCFMVHFHYMMKVQSKNYKRNWYISQK